MTGNLPYSQRLAWDLPSNRLSGLLVAKRRAGADVLDLTQANPTAAGFAYPGADLLDALGDPRALLYEPDAAGLSEARTAVSAYYAARGCTVDAGRILLAASTSESYSLLFKLLADPGDEVLVPRPSYPLFEYLAALDSVRAVPYPLVYHGGWAIDMEALESAVSARTRAVILVNPNNPTGSFLKRAELSRLIEMCARRGAAIISDEVFSDYAFGADETRVPTLAGLRETAAFAMSGLSKVCGLPQMKAGWITAPDAVALARLEFVADTYLSVSGPVQHALPALLEAGRAVREQISGRTQRNLARLRTAMSGSACHVLEVEGGWYATLRVPRTRSEEEWTLELLDRDHVLVQPGFFYDFETEAYFVLSLLTEPRIFDEGVARLLGRVEAAG